MAAKFRFNFRWWMVVIPLLTTVLAIFATRNIERAYNVEASIATGAEMTAVDEMMFFARSRGLHKSVALRLYSRSMVHGDAQKNNNYITARHYKELEKLTPENIKALIDKSSEETTVSALLAMEEPDPKNFVYGLLNWNHQYFCYAALEKIEITKESEGAAIRIRYMSNDPGIAFNTVEIMCEEFIRQYKAYRNARTSGEMDKSRQEYAHYSERMQNIGDQKSTESEIISMEFDKAREAMTQAIVKQNSQNASLATIAVAEAPIFPLMAMSSARKYYVFGTLLLSVGLMIGIGVMINNKNK